MLSPVFTGAESQRVVDGVADDSIDVVVGTLLALLSGLRVGGFAVSYFP